MPKNLGPWQLDKVKLRLRQEQVAREKAASERYRLLSEEGKVRQNRNQDEQTLSLQERKVGVCHWAVILLVCVLVFLLMVCVLALCAVVWYLVNKVNDK
jgi:hypothetical protein